MFTQLRSRNPYKIQLVSLAAHSLLLYLIVAAPARFIQPASMAFGNSRVGTLTEIVYPGTEANSSHPRARTPIFRPKTRQKPQLSKQSIPDNIPHPTPASESASVGFTNGSLSGNPNSGYESRPALPVVFPNPQVERSDIPSGVAGDVIVEVTIDEKGNVADTKILQTLGYGLEEKVLEALKNWRFTPATMNGVAIASRQDVHFHFPG